MAKMGRPCIEVKLDRKVTVRFTQEEFDCILEFAQNQNKTVTQAVRMCIEKEIFDKQK